MQKLKKIFKISSKKKEQNELTQIDDNQDDESRSSGLSIVGVTDYIKEMFSFNEKELTEDSIEHIKRLEEEYRKSRNLSPSKSLNIGSFELINDEDLELLTNANYSNSDSDFTQLTIDYKYKYKNRRLNDQSFVEISYDDNIIYNENDNNVDADIFKRESSFRPRKQSTRL